ncbi:hypothetical protein AXG93_4093s1010 [Marchantia polymorpha subsp. ruderalis]|uniref:Uncharacterized protein n=1 Tax=Marchantia polymorpha subsp. ruderalis TaxID=1480154 RepID=A0A176VT89_MARPO|nr:hypothetical protein AXG93_4093s1010 [Marchantia polymorpha subsp. ruderalis]
MPATDRCLASKQVPFDNSTSGQEPSAQEKYREEPSAQSTLDQTPLVEAPSAQTQLEKSAEDEGRKEETRVLSTQAPSAVADRAGVLCEQVVPLLRYLDRKAAKYADPRHRRSYVELVRNRTRFKVATNPKLISLDQKYRELEEKNTVLHGHVTLSRRLHKTVLQLRDDAAAEAQLEFEKQRKIL